MASNPSGLGTVTGVLDEDDAFEVCSLLSPFFCF